MSREPTDNVPGVELVYREIALLIAYPEGADDREDALFDALADVCARVGVSLEGAHGGPMGAPTRPHATAGGLPPVRTPLRADQGHRMSTLPDTPGGRGSEPPPADEVGSVPADLVAWFNCGKILSERHNLPRIQDRFRVVQVRSIIGDEDEPYVIKGEWREFKSYVAAVKFQKKWANEGHATLLQTGFTFWPDPDEMPGANS